MSSLSIRPAGLDRPAQPSTETQLRKVAQQLEGSFVEQLFKAMRETVPEGGLTNGGSGEEIFSGMMDQHLAEQVPSKWDSGLGAAIYRQLSRAASVPSASAEGAVPARGESGS